MHGIADFDEEIACAMRCRAHCVEVRQRQAIRTCEMRGGIRTSIPSGRPSRSGVQNVRRRDNRRPG